MFLERQAPDGKVVGWIEVICGSMFSGKTEELIRRLRRAEFAHQRIKIFKPSIDTRYHLENIVSHSELQMKAIPVEKATDILPLCENCDVVGIDEAQFFDSEIIQVCNTLANQGIRVLVAGLDMDYRGKPFGAMPYLMAVAEFVTKVHAICTRTGELAHYSFRKTGSDAQVMLGEENEYEPLSRWAYLQATRGKL